MNKIPPKDDPDRLENFEVGEPFAYYNKVASRWIPSGIDVDDFEKTKRYMDNAFSKTPVNDVGEEFKIIKSDSGQEFRLFKKNKPPKTDKNRARRERKAQLKDLKDHLKKQTQEAQQRAYRISHYDPTPWK